MGKTVGLIIGVVAAIAIAVAAPYLAGAFLAAIGTTTATALALSVTTALIGLTLAVGLSLAMRALGVGSVPSAKAAVGPPQVFRQSISNSFIVYGKRRVGGLLAFFHSRVAGSDHFRYFVIAVAGHRCKGVVAWRLNDEIVTVDGSGNVTSGKYAGAANLKFYRGTDTDIADPTFVSECGGKWTTDHKGLGVAKIYAWFKMTDAVVQAGMPNMTADIEGRDEILDTRDATLKYTRNGPLVFYDFMTIPREEGGFGAYSDEVPEDAWIDAQANVADEDVDGEPRYSIDAVMTTGAAPAEVRDALIVNMAGTYAYSGGKHLMRPGYWVPVSVTLSEDDLAGPIQVSPFLTSDTAANEVQGTFINPATNYQGAPFTTQSVASADIRQLDLDLAFTTSLKQANRIANIMLKRAQAEKTTVWPMNIVGLGVKALDTVQADTARYSLSNYAFVVGNWALSADWGVILQLREENEEIYGEPGAVTPSTPPTIVQPTGPLLTGVPAILRASYPKNLSITSEDAGTDATIHLFGFTGGPGTDFMIDYATDTPQDVTVPHGDITGLAYATLYYVFADVTGALDAAPTYGATTVYGDALNSSTQPLRIYLNQLVTTPAAGAGSTGGTSGGGGYGGGTDPGGDPCVTDDTLILMANDTRDGEGEAKAFSECRIDDWVWTRSEATGQMGAFRIAALRFDTQPVFDAGENYPRASEHHRFERGDGNGWLYIESVGEPAGEAVVGQVIIAGAKTYMSKRPGAPNAPWVLSHNEKP